MNKKIKITSILIGSAIFMTTSIVLPIVLSNYKGDNTTQNIYNEPDIDYKLKSHFDDWYNSLTNEKWNKDENGDFIDYKSYSEQQSLCLYANFRGYYWNEPLHQGIQPTNRIVRLKLAGENNPLWVYGEDYKYITQALSRAEFPYEYITYHGVEYMENEFYDQLKDFITGDDLNGYNYSNCVGRTITSYGFLSTSISRVEAIRYCDGWNWENSEINLPLKEKFVFEIKIPKGMIGAAYLADFPLSGIPNADNQILFSLNSKLKIKEWYKENDVNFFKMDLINIG